MRFEPYVPVAQRRAAAASRMSRLRKQGLVIEPVRTEGRTIARSFWGARWCAHVDSFADHASRLPRGRTYVRNGSVCHLSIARGRIRAYVSGSTLYEVRVDIRPFTAARWRALRKTCAGSVGSLVELLQGRLSARVMQLVADRTGGLFPRQGEMRFDCDCPDGASMCKHIAAVLYGVGHRLDARPELLFELRGVDPTELIATDVALPTAADGDDAIADADLAAIFGVEVETRTASGPTSSAGAPRRRRSARAAKSATDVRSRSSTRPSTGDATKSKPKTLAKTKARTKAKTKTREGTIGKAAPRSGPRSGGSRSRHR